MVPLRLSILILFAVLTSTATNSVPVPDNNFILEWINKYLSSQGAYPFDPSPNQILPLAINNLRQTSADDAKYYLYYAFIAYCSDSRRNWTCSYCKVLGNEVHYDSEVSNPIFNTLAYFAHNNVREEIILTFRGSYNVPNVLNNANIGMVPLSVTSGIRVHAGILANLQTLYPQVVAKLTMLTEAFPSYKVIVTGHSLGGSLAALATFKFNIENLYLNTRFELYTFGEPRVGNLAFATAFNALDISVARVVHRADLIPHAPSPYTLGYVHHQNEVWDVSSDMDTDVRFCNMTVYEDPNCSNSKGPIYSVLEHLTYFGNSVAECAAFDDPIETFLQAIVNLNALIPPNLLIDLVQNFFRIPPKYQVILRPILTLLAV